MLLVTLKVRLYIVTKTVLGSNTGSILADIFVPKSKPILVGILYRPPNKSEFVKHINNAFTETGVLDKQECYLLGDLNTKVKLAEFGWPKPAEIRIVENFVKLIFLILNVIFFVQHVWSHIFYCSNVQRFVFSLFPLVITFNCLISSSNDCLCSIHCSQFHINKILIDLK